MFDQVQTDDIQLLLNALPPRISAAIQNGTVDGSLLEVVLDLGRQPSARYLEKEISLIDCPPVGDEDIQYVVSRIGEFGDDNRAGIERTLHRISAIRNRKGKVVGLTCRVGRAAYGTIAIIQDIVKSGKSILLMGKPGVGKTTLLREMARVLADEENKRVIVVDTSNEIAGDGDIPHPGIGRSRRMQVSTPLGQHAVMIEAVENHMPEVIVIDEIGTELEAQAARTIAERGVQLIGTAHGTSLDNLMQNPTLADLIGGIQSVTLGDEEAHRRGTQKSILERKAPPTFEIIVEIRDWYNVTVHPNVARAVDDILLGRPAQVQVRQRDSKGEVTMTGRYAPADEQGETQEAPVENAPRPEASQPHRVYPFGVSRPKLEQAIRDMRLPIMLVRDMDEADLLITLKNYYRRKPQALRDAEASGKSVYVLKNNTMAQMQSCLSSIYHLDSAAGADDDSNIEQAMQDTERAIADAMNQGRPVDLPPQNSYVRQLQHRLVERYNMASRSRGKEPGRYVRVFPSEPGNDFSWESRR